MVFGPSLSHLICFTKIHLFNLKMTTKINYKTLLQNFKRKICDFIYQFRDLDEVICLASVILLPTSDQRS